MLFWEPVSATIECYTIQEKIMTTLYVEPVQDSGEILRLVQVAIESEIAKLELALKMAEKRLIPFEQKYKVTSDHFIAKMSAEDLDGHDEEYVRWAGEYKLMQRLQEKLQKLQEINYDDSSLLHADKSNS